MGRRSHYRSRMRDGLPLPGLTPQEVVSQLIHRVLGPLRPDRLRWVLDYYGLAGAPAAALKETARRNRITVGMMTVQTANVRAAGAALPLHPAIITAAMRPTQPPKITSVAHGSRALSDYPLRPRHRSLNRPQLSLPRSRNWRPAVAPSGFSPRPGRWTCQLCSTRSPGRGAGRNQPH